VPEIVSTGLVMTLIDDRIMVFGKLWPGSHHGPLYRELEEIRMIQNA
jgi:hypothetical protein